MCVLSPISTERFFKKHWGASTLHVQRGDPSFFDRWITIEELDRLVTSIRIPVTNLNLARGDDPLPLQAYANGDYVDKQRVLDLHAEGATIILRAAEQWSPHLNRLRIALEADFNVPAQINVYFTPPGEKSTPPHWDTHDLVVLQVQGAKRWKIFEADRTNPLPEERFRVGEDAAVFRGQEYLLQSGDTLYLPCGTIHEPVAESYSIHLSVGLHQPRLVDLAAEALRLASLEEGSHLRLPLSPEKLKMLVNGASQDLFLPGRLASAAATISARQQLDQAVDLEGRLLELMFLQIEDQSTRYELRPGVRLTWVIRENSLLVHANANTISVGRSLEPALSQILKGLPFEAKSLCGDGSIEQKQALCIALWQVSATREARRLGRQPYNSEHCVKVRPCQEAGTRG